LYAELLVNKIVLNLFEKLGQPTSTFFNQKELN